MSTHTKWVVDEEVPEVVCFVDSSSDSVRARFVNASEVEQLKALVRDMYNCGSCGRDEYECKFY